MNNYGTKVIGGHKYQIVKYANSRREADTEAYHYRRHEGLTALIRSVNSGKYLGTYMILVRK
jgi:hypothetical protein